MIYEGLRGSRGVVPLWRRLSIGPSCCKTLWEHLYFPPHPPAPPTLLDLNERNNSQVFAGHTVLLMVHLEAGSVCACVHAHL